MILSRRCSINSHNSMSEYSCTLAKTQVLSITLRLYHITASSQPVNLLLLTLYKGLGPIIVLRLLFTISHFICAMRCFIARPRFFCAKPLHVLHQEVILNIANVYSDQSFVCIPVLNGNHRLEAKLGRPEFCDKSCGML
jgi:hypothetical protein